MNCEAGQICPCFWIPKENQVHSGLSGVILADLTISWSVSKKLDQQQGQRILYSMTWQTGNMPSLSDKRLKLFDPIGI